MLACTGERPSLQPLATTQTKTSSHRPFVSGAYVGAVSIRMHSTNTGLPAVNNGPWLIPALEFSRHKAPLLGKTKGQLTSPSSTTRKPATLRKPASFPGPDKAPECRGKAGPRPRHQRPERRHYSPQEIAFLGRSPGNNDRLSGLALSDKLATIHFGLSETNGLALPACHSLLKPHLPVHFVLGDCPLLKRTPRDANPELHLAESTWSKHALK